MIAGHRMLQLILILFVALLSACETIPPIPKYDGDEKTFASPIDPPGKPLILQRPRSGDIPGVYGQIFEGRKTGYVDGFTMNPRGTPVRTVYELGGRYTYLVAHFGLYPVPSSCTGDSSVSNKVVYSVLIDGQPQVWNHGKTERGVALGEYPVEQTFVVAGANRLEIIARNNVSLWCADGIVYVPRLLGGPP